MLGVFSQYQDDFWWPILCDDFIKPYLDGLQWPKDYLQSTCWPGYDVDVEADPEVSTWLTCLIFGVEQN